MSEGVVVKCRFAGDTRRFRLPSSSSLKELQDLLVQLYKQLPSRCFLLTASVKAEKTGNTLQLGNIHSDKDLHQALQQSEEGKLLYLDVQSIAPPEKNSAEEKQDGSFHILAQLSSLLQGFARMQLGKNEGDNINEEKDSMDLLCEEINGLALEELPTKQKVWKERSLLLPPSNSVDPASDQERRAAYKKLFNGCSMPYAQVAASDVDPSKKPEKTPTQQPPCKRKRPVFRKSCSECGEPMNKVGGEWECESYSCR